MKLLLSIKLLLSRARTRSCLARSLYAVGVIIGLTLASSATALDYSDRVVLYEEDYANEFTFPTTPEIDSLGMGGLIGFSGSPLSPPGPTLDGTAAKVLIQSDFAYDIELTSGSIAPLSLDSFALRGEFANLAVDGIAPFGLISAGVSALFSQGLSGIVTIEAVVSIAEEGSFGQLRLLETTDGSTDEVTVPLPEPLIDSLRDGDAFEVDLSIDRSTGAIDASVATSSGQTAFATINASALASLPATRSLQFGALRDSPSFPATELRLDLTRLAYYSAPLESVPVLSLGGAIGLSASVLALGLRTIRRRN